jgi:guanylate kinase
MNPTKGKIIVLSGPSGSGKTTLHKLLLSAKRFKNRLVRSVSATTRGRRLREKDGRDYIFISQKMFFYKRRAGHFLESERVFDQYYGTPNKGVRELLNSGKHVLLCIDVKGALFVKQKHPGAVLVFIKPPSIKDLRRRLESRGTEDEIDLQRRLDKAQKEMAEAVYYDYTIVNDDLQKAYRRLAALVWSVIGADFIDRKNFDKRKET